MKFLKSRILLLAVLLLQGVAHAESWWDVEWPLRKKITLDTSASGSPIGEAIGTTALLIRLHDGNFNFTGCKEDGSDLRFVSADDKTVLSYHIEKWDTLLNEALIWVKVPDIKPKEKAFIWLYYGSTGSKATSVNDPKGSYEADTVLAYHFTEKGAPAADSTSSGISAQNAGIAAEGSIIGSGLRLDGKSVVNIPAAPQLAWSAGSPMSLSFWLKPSALGPNTAILSRKDGANSFIVGCNDGVPYVEVNGQRSTGGAAIAPASWHHLAVTAESGKITLYLDGATFGALASGLPALNSVMDIGAQGAGSFIGEIDELNIYKTTLPAGAVKFAYTSQGGEVAAKLVVFGEDEQPTGWMSWLSTGYFGVIVKNLTTDGWAVIIILGVMALISWFVMIGKAGYLGKVSKSNARFLREWSHVANDLTVLDEGDDEAAHTLGGRVDRKGLRAVRNSSIYRIYRIGVEEIRHRVSGGNGSGRALNATSLQAIRASLDGGLVRETQRLNSSMVLLTIAISGGPFLGLLGTVVGVMITFAAIAAAGDVNVNSIAPGIAAALLATVAGLAVAIPALFGYNYLLTRVKSATSDMHVFIDEFITKLAEFYSQRVHLPGGGKSRKPAKDEPAKEEEHLPITREAIQTRTPESVPVVEARREEISHVETRLPEIPRPPLPPSAATASATGVPVISPGMKMDTQRPTLRRSPEASQNHQPQEAAS